MKKLELKDVMTFESTKIIGIENIEFGRYVVIDDFVFIYAKEKITIGSYVHIASFTSISGGGELNLGNFSGIASGCRIITGSEDFVNGGFGNPTIDDRFRNCVRGKIDVGDFSTIGCNSVILPNVVIGEGVTIGANSVVTKDLEPWGVYVGNKRIAERNKKEVLQRYQKFLETPEKDRIGNLFK